MRTLLENTSMHSAGGIKQSQDAAPKRLRRLSEKEVIVLTSFWKILLVKSCNPKSICISGE